MGLTTERETATTWIVSDKRVVANGMAIRMGVGEFHALPTVKEGRQNQMQCLNSQIPMTAAL